MTYLLIGIPLMLVTAMYTIEAIPLTLEEVIAILALTLLSVWLIVSGLLCLYGLLKYESIYIAKSSLDSSIQAMVYTLEKKKGIKYRLKRFPMMATIDILDKTQGKIYLVEILLEFRRVTIAYVKPKDLMSIFRE